MSDLVGITLFTEVDDRQSITLGLPIYCIPLTIGDLQIKTGHVLPAAFGAGSTAAIVFATPFADTNYTVSFDVESLGDGYTPVAINRLATGFTIELNSTNLAGLNRVHWQAMPKTE